MQPETDENGDEVLDEEGEPVMETVPAHWEVVPLSSVPKPWTWEALGKL